jgi:hypothetical protein
VSDLVEQQVKRWQSWQSEPERTENQESERWPLVTISRQFGTFGVELGRRVADRLGFVCWDREIVAEMARRLRTDETTVAALDERARSVIDDVVGVALGMRAISADYGDQLRMIIDSVARQGGAVVVGRGAQFIVDAAFALRVRLVAPFEHRVRAVAKAGKISPEQAAKLVRAGDDERPAFVRQYFGADVADPVHYDIVINTSVYNLARADAVILTAYLAKFGQLPPGVQEEEESASTRSPVSVVPPEPKGT